jgi:hypothetical protein
VITACWAKPCTNFLWEKEGYMNADVYVPPSHKINILLDIKYALSVQVVDAASFWAG